ncbi:MAG: alpha/beta fold hydrolase [Candidatus Sericytochromatia bacterium]
MNKIIEPKIKFKPHLISRNGHFQTIFSSIFHKNIDLPKHQDIIINLDDKNSVKCFYHKNNSQNCAILVHGLEGSADSGYVSSTAKKLLKKGFSVIRVNLRNCGNTLELCETLYNAGMSQDILKIAEYSNKNLNYNNIFLVGFSLGANIVLKASGEINNQTYIKKIVSISPPLDLAECSNAILKPENKIYDNYYLKKLLRTYIKKYKLFPNIYKLSLLEKINNLQDFDNFITAPYSGYKDAFDYYNQNSSINFIEHAKVDTLIIQAKDDPIIPFSSTERALKIDNPKVKYLISKHGGHVGFINSFKNTFNDVDVYWAENRAIDFFTSD